MQYKFSILFYFVCSITFLALPQLKSIDIEKNSSSEIRTINSIMEAKEFLDKISPNALVVFDIGETLTVQKNNLLRIIRNQRIFNNKDIHTKDIVITKFMQHDRNAKSTILSNMLVNSPLNFVEPATKTILQNLKERKIKAIAHCSSKANGLGAIKSRKEWRQAALKKLGIDFSSSFEQTEISLFNVPDAKGFHPLFYKGILFGSPKGKALSAFLDQVKFTPSEIVCFDDCEEFIKRYAAEFKRRNINFTGFIYKAALNPAPKLNSQIVDVQVEYMKKKQFIDDVKAAKIIKRRNR